MGTFADVDVPSRSGAHVLDDLLVDMVPNFGR